MQCSTVGSATPAASSSVSNAALLCDRLTSGVPAVAREILPHLPLRRPVSCDDGASGAREAPDGPQGAPTDVLCDRAVPG